MSTWAPALLGAGVGYFVNLDLAPTAHVTGNDDDGWTIQVPVSSSTYVLAGGPYATQADGEAAFAALVAPPAPPSASFSGSVTYS